MFKFRRLKNSLVFVTNTCEFFTRVTDSFECKVKRICHKCEKFKRICHTCEEFVRIFHRCDKYVRILHFCEGLARIVRICNAYA